MPMQQDGRNDEARKMVSIETNATLAPTTTTNSHSRLTERIEDDKDEERRQSEGKHLLGLKSAQQLHYRRHRREAIPAPKQAPAGICSHRTMKLSHQTTQRTPLERLVWSVLLPFLFVFLLPTVRVDRSMLPEFGHDADDDDGRRLAPIALDFWHSSERASGDLLMALIRLPFDRLKLQSGGLLLGGAQAKEIASKSDLQEEETHMLLLSPAEHRTTYVAAPQQTYQYGGGGPESAPQHEMHAVAPPQGSPDYGAGGGSGGGGGDEHNGAPPMQPGQPEASVVSETAGQAASALQARSDLPAVRALNVKCEKNHMTVNIVFDRPFYGMVFSKGHYNDQKCVHLPPNSGQTSINFDIHLGKCGMSSSDATGAGAGLALQSQSQALNGQQPNGVYIENTIIIQYDPLVQEIFDQARKLRCTWYDYYEKSVTFRPYNVDMLDAVTANFLGDNIQCWMQIQVGKGPWSSEVAGIVKIGQTMTMVLAIKDDENRFDMLVRNCVAHDGKHQPIQLVDEYGCVARPKIMGKFQKVRNFGPAATVVSYAHFQAFKFPDSMSVHFQCVIQVCRYECPEPVCNQPGELGGGGGGGGGGVGQLSGIQGGAGGGSQAGDYATSGTEMVASKEPLPQMGYFGANAVGPTTATAATTTSYANHSHGSNVQLKLDESQGRVQVKLDTSMMAGLNGRPPGALVAAASQQQAAAGPLPPHLLHMANGGGGGNPGESQPTRNYLGASYYRPVVAAASGGQQAANTMIASVSTGGGGAGAGLLTSRQHPQAAGMARSQQLVGAPSGTGQSQQQQQAHILHYSPQYGTTAAARRSSAASLFASRLGELAPDATPEAHAQITPPYEADYPVPPLSLIGSPRALMDQLQHRRVKRDPTTANSLGASSSAGSRWRHKRHLKADSTSVQTQKTIQVVSPDDVAFSLLDPSEDHDETTTTTTTSQFSNLNSRPLKMRQQNNGGLPVSSSVCFSTTRFLWGVLVTLAALVSSIVIVTYVILRQRSQLDRKLSSVFVATPSGESHSTLSRNSRDQQMGHNLTATEDHFRQQQQQQMLAQQQQQHKMTASSVPNLCHPSSMSQRQRDEIQQRNTYLSRLYSQFAPANYWR